MAIDGAIELDALRQESRRLDFVFSKFKVHLGLPRKAALKNSSKHDEEVLPGKDSMHTQKPLDPHHSATLSPKVSQNINGNSSDDDDAEIPDSGWRAWLVVLGAFCANITTVGFVNSSGTIQEYLMSHFLKNESESTVGWIFSIYIFLMFFCGIQTGPLVDSIGIKPVLLPGCLLWCTSLMITSMCTQHYQFILGFSILGGLASSLIYNPSYTVISQWFTSKRSVAISFVAVGGSFTGSFLPIVLSTLFEKVGYGWTIRILSFMFMGLSIIACTTMQSRTKSIETVKWKDVSIDLKCLKSPTFSWCVLGLVFSEWAYFLPSLYIVDNAKMLGFTNRDSNLLLVYFNIGSTFGRVGGGYAGRRYGTFNSMIVSTFLTGLSSLCIWLPVGNSRAGLTAFAVIFGFLSGAGMALGPACVASISTSTNFGKRYGTTYCLVSLAVLTSLPIGGVLTKYNYLGMKIATGVAYLIASAVTVIARWYQDESPMEI